MLIDAVQSVGRFINITEAKVHELLQESQKQKGKAMALREEIIEIEYTPEDENGNKLTKEKSTLIAQLLMTVIQKKAKTKKAFSVVASLVRMHLISLLDVFELLRSTKREYLKKRGSPLATLQTSFAF